MATIKIHNVKSGEVIEREMTSDELAQWETEKAISEARAQELAQAEAKKTAALAKLEALGLDADEVKALGL